MGVGLAQVAAVDGDTAQTYCYAYSEDKWKTFYLQSFHYCFLLAVHMPSLLPQKMQVPLFNICFIQTWSEGKSKLILFVAMDGNIAKSQFSCRQKYQTT